MSNQPIERTCVYCGRLFVREHAGAAYSTCRDCTNAIDRTQRAARQAWGRAARKAER